MLQAPVLEHTQQVGATSVRHKVLVMGRIGGRLYGLRHEIRLEFGYRFSVIYIYRPYTRDLTPSRNAFVGT